MEPVRRLSEPIRRLVEGQPVVIFSKTTCGMSHFVISLIRGFGANPKVYELDKIPNGKKIEEALMQMGCQPSVPSVFIGQRCIGGESQVMSLHVQNRLVPLLIEAGAIWL